MKVAGYVRVSTAAQAEGYGPEVQRNAIAEWAKRNGHTLVLWCQDLGTSGACGLENRPKLALALQAIKEGVVEGLVVFKLDRLARDLVLQETLIAEVSKSEGRVFSTSEGEDAMLAEDGDPSRKLIRQVLGAVSEYERAMIALRMNAGRLAKKQRGGYAGGRPPYGWAAVNRELVPRADEQDVLRGIWGLRDQGWSTAKIADFLREQGIAPRVGSAWSASTIQNIVRRGRRPEPARN